MKYNHSSSNNVISAFVFTLISLNSCGIRQDAHDICKEIGFEYKDSVSHYVKSVYSKWNSVPWNNEYTRDIFRSFVLPPQSSYEPLCFHWQWSIPFKPSSGIDNVKDAAIDINSKLNIISQPNTPIPQKSYDEIMSYGRGKCDDRANLCVYGMRANGIPASFDFIPLWGDGHSGHSFCSVPLPKGGNLMFQETGGRGEQFFVGKVTKIYRKLFFQDNCHLPDSLPSPFNDSHIIDVTAYYNVGYSDVSVEFPNSVSGPVFLSAFTPIGWKPVAMSIAKEGKATFPNMGNGTSDYSSAKDMGVDIGEGIIYLPSLYVEGAIIPLLSPFILSTEERRDIYPNFNNTTNLVLYRKFPKKTRICNYARTFSGCVIEGSNYPDFSQKETLGVLPDSIFSHPHLYPIISKKCFRFVRLCLPRDKCGISELYFTLNGIKYDNASIIADPLTTGIYEDYKCVSDGCLLSYIDFSWKGEKWIGYDFMKPVLINGISFCPRTDDNDIKPGDCYELSLWDSSKWRPIDKKVADDYFLTFDNIPDGALLLLNDLSSGHEVRPFLYINNKQIWY